MSQHPTLGHGKVCYIELPSRDVNESATFYRNVFGWNIRTRGDGHVSFDDGVMEVSGVWRTDRKPVTELGTFIHLMVDDIEVAMKNVVANGGKIVREVGGDAPEITAWFSDPTGNVLGLFQEKGN
jgi:predicted enzyme related to lactoylglutathione lyase